MNINKIVKNYKKVKNDNDKIEYIYDIVDTYELYSDYTIKNEYKIDILKLLIEKINDKIELQSKYELKKIKYELKVLDTYSELREYYEENYYNLNIKDFLKVNEKNVNLNIIKIENDIKQIENEITIIENKL